MKILDPQNAILTNAEVYHFLSTTIPRPKDDKVGAYEPVNLKDYDLVRKDVLDYLKTTAPHTTTLPPPETYMDQVVARLQACGLVKTEALMVINHGIGITRVQTTTMMVGEEGALTNGHVERDEDVAMEEAKGEEGGVEESGGEQQVGSSAVVGDVTVGEEMGEDEVELTGRPLLSLIIDDFDNRFDGEEGTENIEEIMRILKDVVGKES